MNTLRENNTLSSSPASMKEEEISGTNSNSNNNSNNNNNIHNNNTSTINMSTAATATSKPIKPKTPLKKEELEKIALELRKKLSRASITAKKSLSPGDIRDNSNSNLNSNSNSISNSNGNHDISSNSIISNNNTSSNNIAKSSPLKTYILRKQLASSPINNSVTTGFLSSSPNNLYSPSGKSPTHIKTPAAIYLSSSPLKNVANISNEEDSPTKRRKHSPSRSGNRSPQMILEEISRPNTPSSINRPYPAVLKPSLDLTSNNNNNHDDNQMRLKQQQTTPTLQKKDLAFVNTPNILLQTPKQSRPSTVTNGNYNDDEGADLLMYLATSPSPAKPHYSNTPRTSALLQQHTQFQNAGAGPSSSLTSTSTSTSSGIMKVPPPSSVSFIVPPPPVTPKRLPNSLGHNLANTKTPQNRLTPSVNLFNASAGGAGGLPSQGLTLTPNGFNMNDYVNFFTPSPNSANLGNANANAVSKNLLRTPDFNNLLNGATPHITVDGRSKVDGKLLNFNKVLFNNNASSPPSSSGSNTATAGLHTDGSSKD
ncbi:uncharacterized protein RJT21DRAFT_26030 [Scheffersomyces amazonensis]|uniref:uncharacterized protein n=1 Tax=Scheffersomyces amazonensis TaxID=1078765 RepID=UPI00315D9A12